MPYSTVKPDKRYRVMQSNDLHDLENDITIWINRGWIPTGGISVVLAENEYPRLGYKYKQAMWKPLNS